MAEASRAKPCAQVRGGTGEIGPQWPQAGEGGSVFSLFPATPGVWPPALADPASLYSDHDVSPLDDKRALPLLLLLARTMAPELVCTLEISGERKKD